MELVVVNGANNIAKSVIRNLAATGKYSKVRLVDFRPYKKSVYALQRELRAQGVTLEKHQTSNVGSLEIGIEGASELVYFTHDYTSMTSDKNNTLVATSQIARRLGVSKMVAVCPVELDMATSDDSQSWIEKRQEAEQKALDANSSLSLLSTDLVYGRDPSHLVHYMAQSAFAGKVPSAFLSEKAKFKPVAQTDLAKAVTIGLDQRLPGQFALRGSEELSAKELMGLVERSCGKVEGSTKTKFECPMLPMGRMVEELLIGTAVDTNMEEMLAHFSTTQEEPVSGPSFWEAAGAAPEQGVRDFFAGLSLDESDESLVLPTFGSYKTYTD